MIRECLSLEGGGTGHVGPMGHGALLREREMVIAVKPKFAPSPLLSMLYNRNWGMIYHLQKSRRFFTLGYLLLKHFQAPKSQTILCNGGT